jgi:conjugal transfer pilus assembly protein TraB
VKNFKEWFADLSPTTKKTLIYAVAAVGVVLVGVNLYKGRQPASITENTSIKAVEMDKDLLRKTELSESRRKIDEMSHEIEKMQNEQKNLLDKMKSGVPASQAPGNAAAPGLPNIPNASDIESKGRFPPAGQPESGTGRQQPTGALAGGQAGTQQRLEKKTIGEIQVMSNPVKAEAKKTNERTVYLPPSFMSAILLTGLDAGTSSTGKSNPDPVLLRVQTPAVLPNDVKANLAGCFVVGEGQGRLDKERVDIRLVSLSCLTKEGSAVIDTPIKGFVTDADAKTGLAGHVVSKMGATVARTLIAGMLQGAGDMVKQEATTTSASPLGTVSTVDPSKVGTYALGSGLSAGSQRLADFYLTLAKQATPVIEANANKHVTVVISEGKDLVIKKLPQQDDLADNEG